MNTLTRAITATAFSLAATFAFADDMKSSAGMDGHMKGDMAEHHDMDKMKHGDMDQGMKKHPMEKDDMSGDMGQGMKEDAMGHNSKSHMMHGDEGKMSKEK